MKGFGIVLLCLFAVAQSRSTGLQSSLGTPAKLGEYPYVVHLRVAVSTSGLLHSCVGSLYNNAWVLTAASCVDDARFIWIRYGAVDVIAPQLVTETSAVRLNPGYNKETGDNNIALISINRQVESTEYISPIGIAASDAEVPSWGDFCGYGNGEQLYCIDLDVDETEDGNLVAGNEDGEISPSDIGAPLVNDCDQVGILVATGESNVFLNPAKYADWIEEIAG